MIAEERVGELQMRPKIAGKQIIRYREVIERGEAEEVGDKEPIKGCHLQSYNCCRVPISIKIDYCT